MQSLLYYLTRYNSIVLFAYNIDLYLQPRTLNIQSLRKLMIQTCKISFHWRFVKNDTKSFIFLVIHKKTIKEKKNEINVRLSSNCSRHTPISLDLKNQSCCWVNYSASVAENGSQRRILVNPNWTYRCSVTRAPYSHCHKLLTARTLN